MADVVCPECGQVSTLPSIRRASDEFCTHCDFPLFWAPTAVPAETVSASNDSTLRRLPGAGGRLMIGTRVCPTCGELNSIAEKFCTRCHNDMDPQPAPIVAAPPPPPPAPVMLAVKRRWWPWVAFAVITIAMIVIVIVTA
ncbi:MAG: zinc ribbon domain-containing protein [Ilumatobacteraceae bacterium]